MIRRELVHYLEMTDRTQLRPARPLARVLEMRRCDVPLPEVNRFFYTAVGGDWWWVDRLKWTYADWLEFLARPGHETWIAYLGGSPAGYFELQWEPGAAVELVSFGLLPAFVGQGLGGAFLTDATRRAWEKSPSKVWLHTCSFDHPAALGNYLARGFEQVRTETHEKEMPNATPGPWPGAGIR